MQAGMDIVELRKSYGKSFATIGRIDKRALAGTGEDIVTEADSKPSTCFRRADGSQMPDHTVPPDVPYENFGFFIYYVRSFDKGVL
jgi:uroporphyrinogen decarboxylase